MNRGRLRIFKGITIFLPVILLLLVEGLLRLLGYGYDTSLFVKDPDNGAYYVMNPYASAIYFSDTTNATRGNIEHFSVDKTPGSLRIFVLGESTTAGYPYMHNGSFHRWLYYRLLHTYPDRKIEIINVSLTAVNSYTVLDFGRQVLDYQPDAVLVYTGHNEYYGALGIGSTSRIGGNRTMIRTIGWLRRFRLVQLLQNIFRSFHSGDKSNTPVDTRENLMQRMAEKQTIPYRSPDYYAGITQFSSNMETLCRLFQEKKVPIFLSTLVSNEKDQPPFISAGNPTTNSVTSSGTAAQSVESSTAGTTPTAAATAPSAAGQFRLGDSAYKAGAYDLAKQAYGQAAELDLLRFRAPDTLNTIIRQLCWTYRDDIHLVESRSLFENFSPHGILGQETLLEHVHPNLYGYALLSEAYYRSMRSAGFLTPPAGEEMPLDSLLRWMPVTRVDSLNGAYQIMMLKSRWPFHTPIPADYKRGSSPEEQLAGALAVNRITWLDAMDQLFKARMQANDKTGALQAVEAAMLEHPDNTTYLTFCGRLSFETGRWSEALLYFKKLYALDRSVANAKNLLLACIKTDHPDQALAWIKERPESAGSSRQQLQVTTLLTEIISLKKILASSSISTQPLRHQLALDYQLLGAPEAAALYEPSAAPPRHPS